MNEDDDDFGNVSMDTGFAETISGSQLIDDVSVGRKRKRPLNDDPDTSGRSRKSSKSSQGSSVTVVDGSVVGAISRTDTDSTAAGSDADSQKAASMGSQTLIPRTETTSVESLVGSSRGLDYPGSHGKSPGVPLLVCSAPVLSASAGSSGATTASGATVASVTAQLTTSPPREEPAPPVATLVPQASDVKATDFQAPKPVVVAHPQYQSGFLSPLPWGVQWEIARYVNTGFSYSKFSISKLRELKCLGKNVTAAPEVTKYVKQERKAKGVEGEVPDVPPDDNDENASDEFAEAYSREQSAKVRTSVARDC